MRPAVENVIARDAGDDATVYEDTENIFNALAAGASGYMLKRTPAKELIEAIHEVQTRRFADDHAYRAQSRPVVPKIRRPAAGGR